MADVNYLLQLHLTMALIVFSYIIPCMNVQRYDFSALEAPAARRDADGFLHDSPIVGRVGIQEYMQPNGTIRREFRPPEEVFHPDALKSFRGKPVTVDHPSAGRVQSTNAHKFSVGAMLAEGRADGENVRVDMVIHSPESIGDRRQLSLGYTAEVEETPGEWNGQRYDAIQRKINVNHLSVVKVARAGPKARLNLDSADNAVLLDESTLNIKPELLKMPTVKLDNGLSYEAAPEVIAELQRLRNDSANAVTAKQAEIDTLSASRDTLQARVDTLPAELIKARKEGEAAAHARLKLDSVATSFKVDATGKTDREVKELVIKAVHGDAINVTGQTDVYVDAAFDLAVALKPNFNMQQQRQAVNGQRVDASGAPAGNAPVLAKDLQRQYQANVGKKAEVK